MAFKIERGFPVPEGGRPGRPRIYPFDLMQKGDSFGLNGARRDTVKTAASKYGTAHKKRFTVRKLPNGTYRCWRVA